MSTNNYQLIPNQNHNPYLKQLVFPGVSEGRVQTAVSLERVLSVERVHTQVAQSRAEHVLFSAVLQQAVVQRRLGDLGEDNRQPDSAVISRRGK